MCDTNNNMCDIDLKTFVFVSFISVKNVILRTMSFVLLLCA